MANDFDQFPLDDPIIKNNSTYMSDDWKSFIATFFENLVAYLSQYGIFIPLLTAEQIATIVNPQNGQMIYNTTTQAPQIYQNGSWKTFTTS